MKILKTNQNNLSKIKERLLKIKKINEVLIKVNEECSNNVSHEI